MSIGLQLGRPGVYPAPPRTGSPLQGVRLDVTGFVGVALRGPVDTPVLVTSWTDYELRFGAFERSDNAPDRLLPYAVQAFFGQGGERAFVVRVVPPPDWPVMGAEDATARFRVVDDPSGADAQGGPLELTAADEGPWGNHLSVRFDFEPTQTFRTVATAPTELLLPTGVRPPDQSLARVRRPDLPAAGVLRWLSRVDEPAKDPASHAVRLDEALPFDDPDMGEFEIAIVTAVVVVVDSSSSMRREERLTGVGLRAGHPRFLPTVLGTESTLVRAAGDWSGCILAPDPLLRSRRVERIVNGADRSFGISFDSFFDDGAAGDDLLDERAHHRGVDAIGRVPELGLLCVPDLTWRSEKPTGPAPAAPPVARARKGRCLTCEPSSREIEYAEPLPVPSGLDARNREDFAEITRRQARVVDVADLRHRFVALLDVPAGLPVRAVTNWRAGFDSSYAAAYHPWLRVPRPESEGGGSVAVPGAGHAAGIIAARERTRGLAWGPANELARGAVLSVDQVTDAVHDQLHLLGINVYRAERDGFRLTAGRTLSRDPELRQLSVRRLMTMLALALERQTQWLVFEPNSAALRSRLTHTVTQFLRELHRRGYFAGDTEEASFFVHCDDGVNPTSSQAMGRLIAEVGVAPASPLEYIVLRISQDVDGGVQVREGP